MRTIFLLLCLVAGPVWGQITSSVEYGKALELADGASVSGNFLIVPSGGSVTPIPVARVTFAGLEGWPPGMITVEAEAKDWKNAEVYETKIGDDAREYLVFARGPIRVELEAIDFGNERRAKEQIVIEIPEDDDSSDDDQDDGDDQDQDDEAGPAPIHAEWLIWVEEQSERGNHPQAVNVMTSPAIREAMADRGLKTRIYDDDEKGEVERFIGYAGSIRPALIVYKDRDNYRVFPAPKSADELESIVQRSVIR